MSEATGDALPSEPTTRAVANAWASVWTKAAAPGGRALVWTSDEAAPVSDEAPAARRRVTTPLASRRTAVTTGDRWICCVKRDRLKR